MRIVTVIPAFNEEPRVAPAVADVLGFTPQVVVVDDGSRDATAQRATEAGATVVRHVINRGQGAALQTGTDYALQYLDADVIVHFDADGQMQGSDIDGLVTPILQGRADIVLGSRFLGQEAENLPRFRKLMLRGGGIFTALFSGLHITDSQNGFRALSRAAAEAMRIKLDGMAHASEILDLVRVKSLRYVEQPVTIRYTLETLQKSPSNWRAAAIVKDVLKNKLVR
jgi:glycosyltransferase involved in cell wall biosynthesis